MKAFWIVRTSPYIIGIDSVGKPHKLDDPEGLIDAATKECHAEEVEGRWRVHSSRPFGMPDSGGDNSVPED